MKRILRRDILKEIIYQADSEWRGICGYFGHLYAGRGIEVIEAMAAACPNVLFLIFGGMIRMFKHAERLTVV